MNLWKSKFETHASMSKGTNYTQPKSITHSKKRLLANLFPQWELPLYPKNLTRAIAKVERQDYVRKQLFKMEEIRNKEDVWDIISGRHKPKSKGGGRLGLDQLPISELGILDDHDVLLH